MAMESAEFQVYEDDASEWRWRLVAPNGRIIADSAEGYTTRYGAVRGVRATRRYTYDAELVGVV